MNFCRARAMRSATAGFSMVELMIVISLLAIITAFAGTSAGFIQSYRARNAGVELYSALQLARSEAIKRNQTVTITADLAGWNKGWQVTVPDGTLLSEHGELRGVVVTTGPADVSFNRTGRIGNAASPTFQVNIPSATEHVRCVRLDLSGMPQLSKGDCS